MIHNPRPYIMTPIKKPICAVKPSPNNHTRQLYRSGDDNITYSISLQGLPQSCTSAQVVRCILLLEHVLTCNRHEGTCPEGESCRRTKQVLLHHLNCAGRQSECNACLQLLALCRNHSENCQKTKGHCNVLYCKNKKDNVTSSDQSAQRRMKTQQYKTLMMEQTRKKIEEVIKKLVGLPIEQQKLKIGRFLIINPHLAPQVFQILRSIHRSGALLSQEKSNLTTSKRKKTIPQRDMNPKIILNIVVQALASPTKLCA